MLRLDRVTGESIRYERDHPGELIHVDVKKLGRVPDGGGWRVHGRQQRPAHHRQTAHDYVHVAIDDHSRIAFVQARPDEKGPEDRFYFDPAELARSMPAAVIDHLARSIVTGGLDVPGHDVRVGSLNA